MIISIYGSKENLYRGYFAQVCLKCNAIRPFVSYNQKKNEGVNINGVSVCREEDGLGIFLSNCTCCGNVVRNKPRQIMKDWSPADGIEKLIDKTQKGLKFIGDPKYDHLINTLDEIIAKARPEKMHFRGMAFFVGGITIVSLMLDWNGIINLGIYPTIFAIAICVFYNFKIKKIIIENAIKEKIKYWVSSQMVPSQKIIDMFSSHKNFMTINSVIKDVG